MNVLVRAGEQADLDVRVVNCAGCHNELLGDGYLAELNRAEWPTWPRLAWRLFRRGDVVSRRLYVGTELRPFCAKCVKGGRLESVRRRHAQRFSPARAVRAVQGPMP